jgi:hypothetical protein
MSEQTPEPADARRAEQAKEYGKYVAKERIVIDGALAFNAGDPVPVSHVERDNAPVSRDQVVGANTQAAKAAQSQEG